MLGAVSTWLRPRYTSISVSYPSALIPSNLSSVQAANKCAAVWEPSPHGHIGVVTPGTRLLNKKARSPIFSVRAWQSTAPFALAKVSYRRRWPPSNALAAKILSARMGAPWFWVLHLASQSLTAAVFHKRLFFI